MPWLPFSPSRGSSSAFVSYLRSFETSFLSKLQETKRPPLGRTVARKPP